MTRTNPEFVIKGFGLESVRTRIYQAGIEQPLAVSSGDYGAFNGPPQYPANSGGEPARTSLLGTPIFAEAELQFGNKSALLTTVLMTVSQQRNIVTTAIQGRNGTIKEFINEGDYQINLKGALVGVDSYSYPTVEMRDLLELLQVQSALEVVSDFLRLFDVNNLVVTDYSFPQQEGYQNVQLFDINCISDTAELLIEDA